MIFKRLYKFIESFQYWLIGENNSKKHKSDNVGAHNESLSSINKKWSLKEDTIDFYNSLSQCSKESRTNSQVENEFDIFGECIAIQLRQLPLDIALELQLDMEEILIDARRRSLQSS